MKMLTKGQMTALADLVKTELEDFPDCDDVTQLRAALVKLEDGIGKRLINQRNRHKKRRETSADSTAQLPVVPHPVP